jgi:uncharacterized membrane protein
LTVKPILEQTFILDAVRHFTYHEKNPGGPRTSLKPWDSVPPLRCGDMETPIDHVKLAALIIFYLGFPYLAIRLAGRFTVIRKIGVIIVCYATGVLVGNIGSFTTPFYQQQELIASLAIALSLPLLLFSLNMGDWFKIAGKAILSFFLIVLSVAVLSFFGFLLIKDACDEAWKISGMSVGLYTGGTPNLAAIKTALGVDANTYVTIHTYDTLVSAVFLLFVITAGRTVFLKILPPFRSPSGGPETAIGIDEREVHGSGPFGDALHWPVILPLIGAFFLSLCITLIGYGLGLLVTEDFRSVASILVITTLGIAGSLIPAIRGIEKSFRVGMYLIYIFCVVVGSMARADKLIRLQTDLMLYIAYMVFGSTILHALLARIFRIDTDTFLVTATAAICSPPLVPVVAGALKNREIIYSGLATGIIGYAIGNYLGIVIAYLFRTFG